jgi:AcrR family transcriptional regulator
MTDSIPTRGRPRSEARSAEILWAAAQLFARQGVAQTSTRQIAAQAQTTERTLFKHFGSKEGLLRAVMEEAVVAHMAPASLEALRQSIESFGGDLAAWHRALLAERLAALQALPELSRLLMVELLRDERVRAQFAERWRPAAWQPLVSLFESLQGSGRVRNDLSPQRLARHFLWLNLGWLGTCLAVAPDAHWDEGAEIDAIARLFAAGCEAAVTPR